MILIDGKQTALDIQAEIKETVDAMKRKGEKAPHLAAILVGNHAPSETYVNHKVKACARVGFESSLFKFDQISEFELIDQIQKINENPEIDGLIVQLPLPDEINPIEIVEYIHPGKDVDGLHPMNVGRLTKGLPTFISATPLGITMLLERYHIETSGKNCVVIGRSQLVGSPMSILLGQNRKGGNATVTLCHSRSKNLKDICREADILIVAIGKAHFVSADMIKPGAVVIDVGTNRVDDPSRKRGYRLTGDVDFEAAKEVASHITPVPGGVGPMTITGLLYNTLLAARKEIYKK